MVFLGKIIDSKLVFGSISILQEDSLWLSVATADKKDLFSVLILWALLHKIIWKKT